MQKKFFHNGATGDIIFSLPCVKDMGGGEFYITNFDKQRSESIKKLIEVQPYIESVIITDENIEGINLNLFRQYAGHHKNLVQAHYEGQGLNCGDWWKNGWLTLPEPSVKESYCVINRTERYNDPYFNWQNELDYLQTFNKQIIFIGYQNEFEIFTSRFNSPILEFKEVDFLQGAYLIQGANCFSGNYSAWATISQGLGVNYRIEQAPEHTCSTFFIDREIIINEIK